MKKIIILHHCDDIGGAGMSLFNLHKMLVDRYEVVVYVPRENQLMHKFLTERGVQCNVWGSGVGQICAYNGGPGLLSRDFLLKGIKILISKKKLKEILRYEKPDLVIANSITLSWISGITKRMNISSICYVRETHVQSLGMSLNLYYLNKKFNGVIFISQYDKKHYKCKNEEQEVVYNSVFQKDYEVNVNRDEACQRLGLDASAFNVLYVGGNTSLILKGYGTLCETAELLQNEKISFVICGKIVGSITQTNMIAKGLQTNMPLVYRACDILVFPSGKAHQARPAFEAGFMGLPVVISDFEQTKEDVQDEYNGLVFEAGNGKQLAEKIMRLYKDDKLRAVLGKNNEFHSKKLHEFAKCKERLDSLVDRVLSKNVEGKV